MLKIRSNYILKKIVLSLKPKNYLSLMKYNKKIQKKLNISIKDFKIYNQIEIELIPIKDIIDNIPRTVINYEEKNKKYFHIYCDNKRKRVNYIKLKDNISKIKIIIDNEIKSFRGLFENCDYISSINFIKFNRKDIIDMSYMFSKCKNLVTLIL